MKLHLPLGLLSALLAVLVSPSVFAATLQKGNDTEEITSLEEVYDDSVILTIGDGDDVTTDAAARFNDDVTFNITGGTFTMAQQTAEHTFIMGAQGKTVNINMTGGKFVHGKFSTIGNGGDVNISLDNGAIYETNGSGANIGENGSNVNIKVAGGSKMTTNGFIAARLWPYSATDRLSFVLDVDGDKTEYSGSGTTFIDSYYDANITVTNNAKFYHKATGFAGSYSNVTFDVNNGAFAEIAGTRVGESYSTLTFNVSDKGQLLISNVTELGLTGSTLNVNVSGEGSKFELAKATTFGGTDSKVNIKVSGGELILGGGGTIGVTGSSITFDVSGGEVSVKSPLVTGNGARSAKSLTINVSGGVFSFGDDSSRYTLGDTNSTADMNINVSGTGVFKHVNSYVKGANLTLSDQGAYIWDNTSNPGGFKTITMKGGKLVNAVHYYSSEVWGWGYSGSKVIIDTAADFTGELSMGGIDARYLTKIKTSSAVWITDLGGGSGKLDPDKNPIESYIVIQGDDNAMVVTGASAWSGTSTTAPDGVKPLVSFVDAYGSVYFSDDGGTMQLNFTGDALTQRDENGNVSFVVWFTNGELDSEGEDSATWAKEHFVFKEGWDLEISGVDAQGGMLVVSGNLSGVWSSTEDGKEGKGGVVEATPEDFEEAKAVLIDQDTHVELAGEDATLKQLEGSEDLKVTNNATEGASLNISNQDGSVKGDTIYQGNISTGENVDVHKQGDASFTAAGNLEVEGSLSVDEGKLVIGDGSNSSVGSLADVAEDAELVVEGKLTVGGGSASGKISGSGELSLGGNLALGDSAALEGVKLELNGNTLHVDNGATIDIQALDGSGTVDGAVTVSSGEGEFRGKLGSLTVGGSAQQALVGAEVNGELAVDNGAQLALNVRGDIAGDTVDVNGPAKIAKGSTTVFNVYFTGDTLTHEALNVTGVAEIGKGATFKFQEVGEALPEGDLYCPLIRSAGVDGNVENVTLEFSNVFKLYYKNLRLVEEGQGGLVLFALVQPLAGGASTTVALVGEELTENPLAEVANSDVAEAGSNLIFNALRSKDALRAGTQLNQVRDALADLAETDPAAASRVMAAVAGSTVTALGAAQRDALRGEMLRQRSHASAAMPETNGKHVPVATWIEGDGMFNKLHTDGDMSGYRLNSWGGSVGAAISPAKDVTLGLALSAQYGDLEAKAADTAKGDLDAYYLSFLSHVRSSAWGHTFIATIGKHEAKLNRTVDFGSGAYRTHGKTDGAGFGAVYELTYDLPLNETKSSILQPLLSASIVTTSMNGYDENGAGGAGLRVDDQRWTTGSVAVGARWLGKLGASVFGKGADAELRMNIAQDMGDNQGAADVALLADPTYRQRVRGAKVGSTALQMGAGVALPVAEHTSIYTNANADFRTGSHNWNVNFGIRAGF